MKISSSSGLGTQGLSSLGKQHVSLWNKIPYSLAVDTTRFGSTSIKVLVLKYSPLSPVIQATDYRGIDTYEDLVLFLFCLTATRLYS